ncbi:thioredoxin domain-containing protein, partial [Myxococcota bacterium]|nr:thioredoxin domain-containing protein [Myxococcota bacterium]
MTDEHDDENKNEDAEAGSDKKESGRSARAARREAMKKDEEPSTEEPKKEESKKEEPKKEEPKKEEAKKTEAKKAEPSKEEPRSAAKSYAVEKPAEACCGGGSISLSSAVMMMVFFFGLGLVLGGFFLKLGGKSQEKSARTGGGAPPQATQARLKMEIPADAPGFGPADAPVTIVVFDDFQCPWCEKASKVIERVLKEHPADARFVMVNFPLPQLHKEAELAAQAGMEAHAQGKFKQMHDIMFANQRGINRAALDKWAQQIGLDVARFKTALDQNTHQAAVQRHVSMGKSLGVRGTPTMLINGRRFNMTRDMDQNYKVLNALIVEETATVKKQNIPRGQAWQKLTATGVATLEQLTGGPAARPTADAAAPAKGPQAAARREVDPNVSYKMEIEATDTWKGDPKALVTIVEFSEYQCPHCKNADGIVDEILAAYPQGVKFVFLNNPIRRHPHAHPAAVAALEVNAQKGMAAFWAFHKKMFENQKDINP